MIDWNKPLFGVDGNALFLIDGWPQPDCDGDYRVARRDGRRMELNKGCAGKYTVVTREGIAWSDTMRVVADNAVNYIDELAELRSFKETALAAGYVPPGSVDRDLIAARRIVADLDDPDMSDESRELILAGEKDDDTLWGVPAARKAIAWARANPR